MFDNMPLDRKIFFLSKLDKKNDIKNSIDTFFKGGPIQRVLGIGYLAVDFLAPNFADSAIRNSMNSNVDELTITWFKKKCIKIKVTENWTCFRYKEKIVGAEWKDHWFQQYYQINDLDHKTIEDFLYQDAKHIHINCDMFFQKWGKKEEIPEGSIQPIKKKYEGRKLLDKQINVLIGPSGSGKTSCALSNCKSTEKVIVAAGAEALYSVDDILSMFNPDVLILDDIEIQAIRNSNKLITVIDRIRLGKVKLFVTLMVDEIFKQEPGALYLPGLRPGRVDQIVFFDSLTSDERIEFLKRHEITDVDISKTSGFTYAYMLELIKMMKEENRTYEDAAHKLTLFIPVVKEDKHGAPKDRI